MLNNYLIRRIRTGAGTAPFATMVVLAVVFLCPWLYASVLFQDNFTAGTWSDSDQIAGFWSRSQGSGTSIDTDHGRLIQTFGSPSNNRFVRLYSQNQENLNFASQIIVARYNHIEELMVGEFLGSDNYNYRKGFGFTAEPGIRFVGGADSVIAVEQHFRMANQGRDPQDHSNTFRLYAGQNQLDSYVQYMPGPPIVANRDEIMLLSKVELILGPTMATANLYFHGGDSVTLTGEHGFDPEIDPWIQSPALGIQGFASRTDSDSRLGFAMGSMVVEAPFAIDLEPAIIDVGKLDSITLGPVELRGSRGDASYQWFFDGQPIPGATGKQFQISELSTERLGTYYVKVDDERQLTPLSSSRLSLIRRQPEWPAWRYDHLRSGTTPHRLAGQLHLQWTRELPAPQGAWPRQVDDVDKLAFDQSYTMVAAENLLLIPSMVEDSVSAYEVETGQPRWRFHAGGPVRLPPVVKDDRLYFAADDGYVYCLEVATGDKLWRFQAAPSNRMVLGNERIISLWPVRGGPVIKDDTLYFAAGIWPHEGVFVYALDLATAEVKWRNSASSSDLIVDSKRYYSFGGVAPQGPLAVAGDRLFVPGGRTPPAVFDRHTGELLYFNAVTPGRSAQGGFKVHVRDDWFFNPPVLAGNPPMHAVIDGAQYGSVNCHVTTEEAFIGLSGDRVVAHATSLEATGVPPEPEFDRLGRVIPEAPRRASSRAGRGVVTSRLGRNALRDNYSLRQLWESEPVEGLRRIHLNAAGVIYGSGDGGRIFAVTMPHGEIVWEGRVDGEVFEMIVAYDRLFVMTESGTVHCFGQSPATVLDYRLEPKPNHSVDPVAAAVAESILAGVDPRGGYALVFGAGSTGLLDELLRQSEMHFTVFDPDPAKVAELRARMFKQGWYGKRVSVQVGNLNSHRFPPYVASLIVCEDPAAAGFNRDPGFVERLFHPLRPYGGLAVVLFDQAGPRQEFLSAATAAELEQSVVESTENLVTLVRPGPLPGAGIWSHQSADAGNTAYSGDDRVRAPLGVAWFGGEPNHKTLPRHMSGPIPQVVGGRLLLIGPHHVSARCVYTGVELWAVEMPEVGESFTSWEHERQLEQGRVYFPGSPGAHIIGSPMVSTQDSVYVVYRDQGWRLDVATGEKLGVFAMPGREQLRQHGRDPFTREITESYAARLEQGNPRSWGNMRYLGDYLIVAAHPHMFDDQRPGHPGSLNAISSEFIVVMDRYNGEIKWVRQARYGFRHNAIAAGSDKIFVIDHITESVLENLQRRGREPDITPRIQALCMKTGDVLWTYDKEVFGTALAYSEYHDILVQSGHPGHRREFSNEPRDRIHVLRGETGQTLWSASQRQRRSPLGLHLDWGKIIGSTGEGAWDMETGEIYQRANPVSGNLSDWTWLGALRCGTQNFSRHLVTFRSGAAAFADLAGGWSSGNITGIRSGCTNNLVVADGMLNAPEYTRSCSCSYQLQTSVGLVHTPDAEMWTYGALPSPQPGEVESIGINFGAPGNRHDDKSDVFWVGYPYLVGPAPQLPGLQLTTSSPAWFRHHSSLIRNPAPVGLGWVASYGLRGIEKIELELKTEELYDLTLYFIEPDELMADERVFDLFVQGQKVVEAFDVAAVAGGPLRMTEIKIAGVSMAAGLEIRFEAGAGSLPPVVSGLAMTRSHP